MLKFLPWLLLAGAGAIFAVRFSTRGGGELRLSPDSGIGRRPQALAPEPPLLPDAHHEHAPVDAWPTRSLSGEVRWEDGTAIDAPVTVRLAATGGHGRIPSASATTDAQGRFRMALPSPPAAALGWATVTDRFGARLLSGPVSFDAEIRLAARKPLLLAGRWTPEGDALRPEEFQIAAYVLPPVDEGASALCGAVVPEADGVFLLRIDAFDPSERFAVVLLHRGAVAAHRSYARAELQAGGALDLPRRFVAVRVQVRDPAGAPLRGAALCAAQREMLRAVPPAWAYSDDSGTADWLAEPGFWELCIGHPGYVPAIRQLDLSAGAAVEQTVVLRPTAQEPPISGRVLAADGRPVAGALVTYSPLCALRPDLGTAGAAQTRTGADGGFTIAALRERPAQLAFFHEAHGLLEAQVELTPRSSLRAQFGAYGELHVDLEDCPGGGPSGGSGAVDYALFHRERDLERRGSSLLPLHLPTLDAGPYNLYLRLPDGSAYAAAGATVTAGRENPGRVLLQRGNSCRGAVHTRSGAVPPQLIVRVAHPGWPESLRRAWGSSPVGADGRFQAFAGDLRAGRAEVWRGERRIGEFSWTADADNRVELALDATELK